MPLVYNIRFDNLFADSFINLVVTAFGSELVGEGPNLSDRLENLSSS